MNPQLSSSHPRKLLYVCRVLTAIALVSLLSGCEDVKGLLSEEVAEAVPLTYPKGPLLFIGDGFGVGKGLQPGESAFPELIQERLIDQRNPLRVINLSSEGFTTKEGLALASTAVRQYKPSTIVIALGYADMKLQKGPQEIRRNLSAIASMGRLNAVRIVICGFGTSPIYAEIQKEDGAIIVPDYLRGVKGSFYSSRMPYPNSQGHELIRETLWSTIRGELNKGTLDFSDTINGPPKIAARVATPAK
jgi:acyl-CoA thioesterase-1